jgi:hypothetical protein
MTKRIVMAALFLSTITVGSAVFADEAKKPAPAKPDKEPPAAPAEPAAVPKCRAVEKDDATKVIAEAEEKSVSKCTGLLMAKVKEAKCSDPATKGKRITYTTQYEQMTGTGKNAKKMKDSNTSVACPKK